MDFGSAQLYTQLLTAALILVAPGTALYLGALHLTKERVSSQLSHVVLVGVGLSVGFWPLLLLYVSLVGLRFTPVMLWVVTILPALYVVYRVVTQRRTAWLTPGSMIMVVSLGGMTLLALLYRLGDVQGLAVPMFGDSLHHTLIATLIYNSGQVPQGYLPYVPVDTFTYHFGFHTLAAVFAQMTGTGVPQSVLFLGQVLNVATVPLAYALNRWLFHSRLAGLGAALLTGFVSIMPAYYVNWGRYTQLAGHILLIPSLIFLVKVLGPGWKRRDIGLCAFCVAGLVVVHYRILIFFGLFAVALVVWQLVSGWRDRRSLVASWSRGLLAIIIGFAATLPWLVNLAINYFPGLARRLGSVTADYLQEYNNTGTITKYVGQLLPGLALLGLIISLGYIVWKRKVLFASKEEISKIRQGAWLPPYVACLVLALWAGLIVGSLWVYPGAIGSISVAIAMYIPLSALGGYTIGWLCERVRGLLRLSPLVFAAALVGLAPMLAQSLGTSHVADLGRSAYLQPADQMAFEWIRGNVSRDARFLISSQLSYTGRGVTASDGGMWLPLLTGNNVSPPALSAWMERPIAAGFFTQTRELAAYTQPKDDPTQADPSTQARLKLQKTPIITEVRAVNDPRTLELMHGLGITHIYSGAQGGASRPRLDVALMRKDDHHFRLLYTKDGVYIFQVQY